MKRGRPRRERAVQDVVPFVGDEGRPALASLRRTASSSTASRRSRVLSSRSDDLDRQAPALAQAGDELARLGDDDEALRRLDHELLAQQRPSPALEHGEARASPRRRRRARDRAGRVLRPATRSRPRPPAPRSPARRTRRARCGPRSRQRRAVAKTARPEPRPSRVPGSTSSSAARTATAGQRRRSVLDLRRRPATAPGLDHRHVGGHVGMACSPKSCRWRCLTTSSTTTIQTVATSTASPGGRG